MQNVVDYLREMFPALNLPESPQRVKTQDERPLIFCQLRKRFLVLTPEEWVRQNLVSYLNRDLGYPLSLMKIERQVKGGGRTKRADLIVCNTKGEAQILVECKAPTENLTKETFFQLGRYNRNIEAKLLLISNGMEHYCCHLTVENEFKFLDGIPAYSVQRAPH